MSDNIEITEAAKRIAECITDSERGFVSPGDVQLVLHEIDADINRQKAALRAKIKEIRSNEINSD